MGLGFGRWAAGKTIKYYKLKKGVDIKQFKTPKKDVIKKIEATLNRESARTLSQAGSGVNIKFKKSGMPYVPKGTKSSMLTRTKGLSKIAAPAVGYLTATGKKKK